VFCSDLTEEGSLDSPAPSVCCFILFCTSLIKCTSDSFLVYCMYANITTVLYPRECAFARQNASASKRPFYTVLYS